MIPFSAAIRVIWRKLLLKFASQTRGGRNSVVFVLYRLMKTDWKSCTNFNRLSLLIAISIPVASLIVAGSPPFLKILPRCPSISLVSWGGAGSRGLGL